MQVHDNYPQTNDADWLKRMITRIFYYPRAILPNPHFVMKSVTKLLVHSQFVVVS